MTKGLEQLLAKIKDQPKATLIARYLSLIAELPDAQKQSEALALARALVKPEPAEALRIAHMVFQHAPENLEALDILVEALNAKGRFAKAEVLKRERAKLAGKLSPQSRPQDGRQKNALGVKARGNPNEGPGAGLFAVQSLSDAKGNLISPHPTVKLADGPNPRGAKPAAQKGPPGESLRAVSPVNYAPEESMIAEIDLGADYEPSQAGVAIDRLFPLDISASEKRQDLPPANKEAGSPKADSLALPAKLKRQSTPPSDTILPFRSQPPLSENLVKDSALAGRGETSVALSPQPLPDIEENSPVANEYTNLPELNLEPSLHTGAHTPDVTSADPNEERERKILAAPRPSPRQVMPDLQKATPALRQKKRGSSRKFESGQSPDVAAEITEASVPVAELFDHFWRQGLYLEAQRLLLQAANFANHEPWWQARRAMLASVPKVDAAQVPHGPTPRSPDDQTSVSPLSWNLAPELQALAARLPRQRKDDREEVGESLPPASSLNEETRQRLIEAVASRDQTSLATFAWELMQALWGQAPGQDVAHVLDWLQLSRSTPAFWGFYLDALLATGNSRKALDEIRHQLIARPHLAWANTAWARLELVWSELAVQGFPWHEDEGVEALIVRLRQRQPPKLSALLVY